ncbi:hypothetical protein L1887_01210 [Cichorium endivia]|nr:hypothetical protein L1887_01210 [Cichorium endivia]
MTLWRLKEKLIDLEPPVVEFVKTSFEHENNKDTADELLARNMSSTSNNKVNREKTFTNGHLENLDLSGCFGSFPSNMDRPKFNLITLAWTHVTLTLVAPIQSSAGGSINSESISSHINEVEATTHISTEVGFEIEVGNVILNEVMGANDVSSLDQ